MNTLWHSFNQYSSILVGQRWQSVVLPIKLTDNHCVLICMASANYTQCRLCKVRCFLFILVEGLKVNVVGRNLIPVVRLESLEENMETLNPHNNLYGYIAFTLNKHGTDIIALFIMKPFCLTNEIWQYLLLFQSIILCGNYKCSIIW